MSKEESTSSEKTAGRPEIQHLSPENLVPYARNNKIHTDEQISSEQLTHRLETLEAQQFETEEVTEQVVIEVLLVLIRYPGSRPGDVARRLKGRTPPIGLRHVQLVFDRYDLDAIGEKGGSTPR